MAQTNRSCKYCLSKLLLISTRMSRISRAGGLLKDDDAVVCPFCDKLDVRR